MSFVPHSEAISPRLASFTFCHGRPRSLDAHVPPNRRFKNLSIKHLSPSSYIWQILCHPKKCPFSRNTRGFPNTFRTTGRTANFCRKIFISNNLVTTVEEPRLYAELRTQDLRNVKVYEQNRPVDTQITGRLFCISPFDLYVEGRRVITKWRTRSPAHPQNEATDIPAKTITIVMATALFRKWLLFLGV